MPVVVGAFIKVTAFLPLTSCVPLFSWLWRSTACCLIQSAEFGTRNENKKL